MGRREGGRDSEAEASIDTSSADDLVSMLRRGNKPAIEAAESIGVALEHLERKEHSTEGVPDTVADRVLRLRVRHADQRRVALAKRVHGEMRQQQAARELAEGKAAAQTAERDRAGSFSQSSYGLLAASSASLRQPAQQAASSSSQQRSSASLGGLPRTMTASWLMGATSEAYSTAKANSDARRLELIAERRRAPDEEGMLHQTETIDGRCSAGRQRRHQTMELRRQASLSLLDKAEEARERHAEQLEGFMVQTEMNRASLESRLERNTKLRQEEIHQRDEARKLKRAVRQEFALRRTQSFEHLRNAAADRELRVLDRLDKKEMHRQAIAAVRRDEREVAAERHRLRHSGAQENHFCHLTAESFRAEVLRQKNFDEDARDAARRDERDALIERQRKASVASSWQRKEALGRSFLTWQPSLRAELWGPPPGGA